jgi:hypothetical protein
VEVLRERNFKERARDDGLVKAEYFSVVEVRYGNYDLF